jgi:hypothetical protein
MAFQLIENNRIDEALPVLRELATTMKALWIR